MTRQGRDPRRHRARSASRGGDEHGARVRRRGRRRRCRSTSGSRSRTWPSRRAPRPASSRPTRRCRAYLEGRTDRPWTAERSDPDAELARRLRVDSHRADAARRDAAPAGERRAGRGRGRDAGRPGLHRQLLERHDDRPSPGGRDPARAQRAPGLPADRRPGDAADLPRGAARRACSTSSSRRARWSRRPPAARASAAGWASSPPASAPSTTTNRNFRGRMGSAEAEVLPRERLRRRRGCGRRRDRRPGGSRRWATRDRRGQRRGHPGRRRRHRRASIPAGYLNIEDPEQMKALPLRGLRPVAARPARRRHDLRHRAELRHRLLARARAAGDEGVGRQVRGRPSFARIFRRNCVNLGLPVLECTERGRRPRGRARRSASTPTRARSTSTGRRSRPRPIAAVRPRAAGRRRARALGAVSDGRLDDRPGPRATPGRSCSRPTTRTSSAAFARAWAEPRPAARVGRRRRRAARRRLGGLGAVAAGRRRQAGELPRRRTSARTSPSTGPGSPRSPSRIQDAGLLVSMHGAGIYRQRYGLDPGARPYAGGGGAGRGRRLRRRAGGEVRRRRRATQRADDYELLQLLRPALALLLHARRRRRARRPSSRATGFEPVAPWHVRMSPVPLRRRGRPVLLPDTGVKPKDEEASDDLLGDGAERVEITVEP